MYLLDTNIFINFYDRYYRMNLFPTFWKKLVTILNSCVEIPEIILSETYQSPEFKEWIGKHFQKTLLDHRAFSQDWLQVLHHIQNSSFYKDEALSLEKGWANDKIADPWLIAIAKSQGFTIVTEELRNPSLNAKNPSKNAKIPDVCDQLGIRCISMNTFFEEIHLNV